MTQKTEGTITLDGIIEGKVGDEDTASKLREWTTFIEQLGLRFTLDLVGGQFSLLPETEPVSTANLGDKPDHAISEALGQLVEALPESVRPNLFSTLRSAEYRKGEEVQVLYAIAPDGSIDVQRRVVEARTVAPPEPVKLKTKIKLAIGGLVIALAFLGFLSLFIDFSGLIGETVESMRSVTTDDMTIEIEAFEGVLEIDQKSVQIKNRRLVLVLKRGENFPADAEAWDNAIQQAPTAAKRLALEAIYRSEIKIDLYNLKDDKFYTTARLRVRDLLTKNKMPISIPLHSKFRTGRVVFTF